MLLTEVRSDHRDRLTLRRKNEKPRIAATTLRDVVGKVVNKTQKTGAEVNQEEESRPIAFSARLDHSHASEVAWNAEGPKRVTSRTNKNMVKKPKINKITDITTFVQWYNIFAELASAPCGLTFGQLLRGEVQEACTQLKKILRSSAKVNSFASPVTGAPRRLKLVSISIIGNGKKVLFDSGAIPNLMSAGLAGERSYISCRRPRRL